jgi:hypothetical protein
VLTVLPFLKVLLGSGRWSVVEKVGGHNDCESSSLYRFAVVFISFICPSIFVPNSYIVDKMNSPSIVDNGQETDIRAPFSSSSPSLSRAV